LYAPRSVRGHHQRTKAANYEAAFHFKVLGNNGGDLQAASLRRFSKDVRHGVIELAAEIERKELEYAVRKPIDGEGEGALGRVAAEEGG
jgi:hypothetical protein